MPKPPKGHGGIDRYGMGGTKNLKPAPAQTVSFLIRFVMLVSDLIRTIPNYPLCIVR